MLHPYILPCMHAWSDQLYVETRQASAKPPPHCQILSLECGASPRKIQATNYSTLGTTKPCGSWSVRLDATLWERGLDDRGLMGY